jgi:hypothetical protein
VTLSLISIDDGVIRLQFESSRAWPGSHVRTTIEDGILEAAPEVSAVVVEGIKEAPLADFVPVTDLVL